MIVFRLESIEFKLINEVNTGIYRTLSSVYERIDDRWNTVSEECAGDRGFSERHPAPSRENLSPYEWLYTAFGFASIELLNEWFPIIEARRRHNDIIQIGVYETDEYRLGRTQLIFNAATTRKIITLSAETTEFTHTYYRSMPNRLNYDNELCYADLYMSSFVSSGYNPKETRTTLLKAR